MDYIRIVELPNTYPQPGNYIKVQSDVVSLFGLYADENKLDFSLPSLDKVTKIDKTSFRFIMGVRLNNADKEIKYFTSEEYYDNLKSSITAESNPYFITYSLKPNYIVYINVDNFIKTFELLQSTEPQQGVKMLLNNFIDENKNIDYSKLASYIDWVLSPPTIAEIGTDGVIPAEKIAKWQVGDYDPIKMEWSFNPKKDKEAGSDSVISPQIPPTVKKYKFESENRSSNFLGRGGIDVYSYKSILGGGFGPAIRTINVGETFYAEVEPSPSASVLEKLASRGKAYYKIYLENEGKFDGYIVVRTSDKKIVEV